MHLWNGDLHRNVCAAEETQGGKRWVQGEEGVQILPLSFSCTMVWWPRVSESLRREMVRPNTG